MSGLQWISLGIVLLTYAGIAVGRVPRFGMSRTTMAIVGAAALLAIGAASESQAFAAIDLSTIILLFGMMVINVNLRSAGFFDLVGNRVLRLARSPRLLLALIIGATGVLSPLFLNDPLCLLFTPLVLDLTRQARRDPIPYLIGLTMAANVGSVATITGNPQNILIGSAGAADGITYLNFAAALVPVALIGLVICWVVIVLMFPDEFRGTIGAVDMPAPRIYRPLLWRSLTVVVGVIILFFIGVPVMTAVLIGAALLLVSRLKPSRLLAVDWDLLAFFIALFIVTGAVQAVGISDRLFTLIAPLISGGIVTLTLVTAVLSNLVSNVPAVLLLRPAIGHLTDPKLAWLTLAMASTLAGNLTLLGSVANLIVAEIAAERAVRLTFRAYLRVGVPITLLTLIVGIVWLTVIRP